MSILRVHTHFFSLALQFSLSYKTSSLKENHLSSAGENPEVLVAASKKNKSVDL